MWNLIIDNYKQKKYIVVFVTTLVFFISIYTMLDYFNIGYEAMIEEYGVYLVVLNILINLIMSIISAYMITVSTIFYKQSGQEGKGTTLTGISIIFGLFTYGCTPCLIAFLSTIGITFSVLVLPFAGLPYKFISILILVLGYFWLKYEIKHTKCKIR